MTRLPAKEGEPDAVGQQATELADLSGWKVVTENLTGIDLPQIALNQPAELTFGALLEVALPGTVSRISPGFEMKSGDVVYRVEIELLDIDRGLQWGLTTGVTFEVGNAPAAASSPAGGQRRRGRALLVPGRPDRLLAPILPHPLHPAAHHVLRVGFGLA